MDILNLNNILHEYNYNHRLYNENIGRIISLIENNEQNTTRNRAFTTNRNSRSHNNRPLSLQDQILFFLNSAASTYTPPTTTTQNRPTREQIQENTENLYYSSDLGLSTICPISLETFQSQEPITRIRHCGHIFRQECLQRWFENHSVCPVCRYNITTTRQTNSTIENNTAPASAAPATTTTTVPALSAIPSTRNARQNTSSYSILSQLLQSVMDLSGSGYTTSIGNSGDLLYEISIPLFRGENTTDTEDSNEFTDTDIDDSL